METFILSILLLLTSCSTNIGPFVTDISISKDKKNLHFTKCMSVLTDYGGDSVVSGENSVDCTNHTLKIR